MDFKKLEADVLGATKRISILIDIESVTLDVKRSELILSALTSIIKSEYQNLRDNDSDAASRYMRDLRKIMLKFVEEEKTIFINHV